MSQFNANIVVQPIESTLVVEQNSINLTPSDVQLNVFGTGPRGYAGSIGALGYGGSLGFSGSIGPQGAIGITGAQGPQGPKGDPDGYTGSIGFTGSKGDPGGYTGSAGTIGVDGYNGSVGAQGPQGPFGFTGSKGDPDGYTGSIGAQGPQGPKGDPDGYTGSIGPQGPIGYTGSASNYIENGTSNVSIPVANGNITMSVNGTSNVAIVSSTSTQFNNLSLLKFGETIINGGNVSGTITPDAAVGTIYNYTLTGNITLNSLGNVVAGTSMTIVLTQDSVGGRILTTNWKYASGIKTLSVAPNSIDVIFVFYNGVEYLATLNRGFV